MAFRLFSRQEEAGGGLEEFQFYHYEPSMAAAVIFVIAFFGTTAFHGWQMFKTRTWFLIPFFIGGICKYTAARQFRSWTTEIGNEHR